MFSKSVARTDAFLDMSQGTQNLYFHLGIEADDDGFVSPKMIMRMLGSTTDDLKTLVVKGFVIPFESGVIVIRHWRENNYIQSDRYKPSLHIEREKLLIDDNGLYQHEDEYDPEKPDNTKLKRLDTKCIQNVRVGEVRLGKGRLGKDIPIATPSVAEEFDLKDYIRQLEENPRRDYGIIALYWQFKKPVITNKGQASVEIKRSLRAASNLKPYEDERIYKTMQWLDKKADFKWTLETVVKYISEDLTSLKK